MRSEPLNKNTNVFSFYRKELRALKIKATKTALSEKEKERMRDISKIIELQDNNF